MGETLKLPTSLRLASVEAARVRSLMQERGWNYDDLVRESGLSKATLQEKVSKGIPHTRTRLILEAVFRQAIWSSAEEFRFRMDCIRRLKVDPYLVDRRLFVTVARRLGIELPGAGRSRPRAIHAIACWLAAHPKYNQPKTTNATSS